MVNRIGAVTPRTGKFRFRARVTAKSDRVSRTGWGIFYHEKPLFPIEKISAPRWSPLRRVELAPIEIRDFAYQN